MKVRSPLYLPAALAVFALLASACAAGKAGGGAALHVWPAGTAVTYEVTGSQTQAIEVPGGGTQGGTGSSTIVFDISALADRQFKVAVADASQFSDPPDPNMPDVSGLVGLESTVRLDERGLVIEASGLERNAYIMEMGGVEDFRETLQTFFLYLPEGGLGPGVEWSREYSYPAVQQGLQLQFSITDAYKCLEMTTYEGTPSYRIELNQAVSFSGGGEMQGMAMDMALAGTSQGTMYVDASTGLLLYLESTGRLRGGIAAMGMDMPMDMSSTSTVRVKK